MRKYLSPQIISTGLAIFSMFFGAGNLMYPIRVGQISGSQNPWGIAGFLITTVLLPLAGLIVIILFQGDYSEFFNRLGRVPGFVLMFFCTAVVGPLIAMPRIVTLSYTMISPFIPGISLITFSISFLLLTFFATYKESRIVDFLGYVISPLLLISLVIIIVRGYLTGTTVTTTEQNALEMFWHNLKFGYQTLDLLGGIFFSSFVISILQKNYSVPGKTDFKKLALLSIKAGSLGVSLLGLVYIGMSHLGVYFGHGLENINEGELFSAISFRVLGSHGAAIISIAVLMACFSTSIALTGVYAEYLSNHLFKNKINYITAAILTLLLTFIPSNFGLSAVLKFSAPLIYVTYPTVIVLTLLNIAYKMFDFKPVKLPVLITLIISLISYFM
jgi:branched-chain amino acid:cation transporter, LIVCS family